MVDTVCYILLFQRQTQNPNGKEIQMLVQRSQVGSVIGRGGYKIKETREVLTEIVTCMNIDESLFRDILTDEEFSSFNRLQKRK